MKKRILSLVIALLMAFAATPVSNSGIAVEAPTLSDGDWQYIVDYTVEGGAATITKYTGNSSAVVIPEKIGQDIPVVALLYHMFYKCKSLTSVTISNNVERINDAFVGCTNLTSVTIPNSVKRMINAFEGCTSLTSITIPYGVEEIDNAFYDCTSLTSVTIPNSVISMSGAFYGCTSLTSVTISNGVTNIVGAFSGCTSLTSVIIPNGVINISGAFRNCTSLVLVTIPNGVTSIGDSTFYGCTSLTSVTIPNSVTKIDGQHATWLHFDYQESYAVVDGNGSFEGCTSLSAVTIPSSVEKIDWGAFRGCTNLSSVTIRSAESGTLNMSIGTEAFADCINLSSAYIPKRVTSIGSNIFKGIEGMGVLTIYGDDGSAAQTYAKNNNILFKTSAPVLEPDPSPFTVVPTSSNVYVNGKQTSFEAYNVKGNNYFKLRDLAFAVNGTSKQFEVGYDDVSRAVTLTSGKPYTPNGTEMKKSDGFAKSAILSANPMLKDGVGVEIMAYNIDGNNFVKLRDVMKLFNIGVTYDDATRSIGINTNISYTD